MTERPPRGGLARLVQKLTPGGRLVGMRRLKGGLGARMHVLRIEETGGARRNVVLRRYRPQNGAYDTPEAMTREFEVLALLQRAGVRAAEPLLLDAEGHFLGVPAMALSYLEGRSWFDARDTEDWCRQLAWAALAIHAITPEQYDLSRLPAYDAARAHASIEKRRLQVEGADPLALEVVETLEPAQARIEWLPRVLVHEDFWPGNTVWRRGKLIGVVDWTSVCVGDPRLDVAQCRVDIVISHDIVTADAFLSAYEAQSGAPLPDVWFFDLMKGLLALLFYEKWLIGYHEGGLRHLTAEAVGARLRAFLRHALASA